MPAADAPAFGLWWLLLLAGAGTSVALRGKENRRVGTCELSLSALAAVHRALTTPCKPTVAACRADGPADECWLPWEGCSTLEGGSV